MPERKPHIKLITTKSYLINEKRITSVKGFKRKMQPV
jgi:hypothetical protein